MCNLSDRGLIAHSPVFIPARRGRQCHSFLSIDWLRWFANEPVISLFSDELPSHLGLTMKTALFVLCALSLALTSLRAANDPALWRSADDARVQAMISGDASKLAETFSDELLYVHSNGKPDTKASFTEALVSGKSKYNSITYEQREFREVAPGLVLMNGRCRLNLGKAAPFTEAHLSFLAAYRLEKGVWRFLAWQSCKLPEPEAAKKP